MTREELLRVGLFHLWGFQPTLEKEGAIDVRSLPLFSFFSRNQKLVLKIKNSTLSSLFNS